MVLRVPNGVRQLPVVGPWASRIGRVIDIWGMPCNPTTEIWVLAAWHTIPMCALALIKPSALEYINSRLGSPHRRKRPQFRLSSLPLIEGHGAPVPGEYTWVRFGINKALVVFQYIQFIDVTTRGLVQWSSMAYSWSGCQVPGAGGGFMNADGPNVQLGSTSNTQLNFATTTTYQQNCIGAAFNWACAANQQWSASYSISWEQIEGFPPPSPQFTLVDKATNQPVGENFDPKASGGGYYNQGFYRHDNSFPSPKGFAVLYKSDFSFRITSASFSVSGSANNDFMKPDP